MKSLLLLSLALFVSSAQAEALDKAYLIVNQQEYYINGVDKLPLFACVGESYSVGFQNSAAAKTAYSLPTGVYGCEGEFLMKGSQLQVLSLGACRYVTELELSQACK